MSEKSEKKATVIKPEIRELAAKIREALSADTEVGVVSGDIATVYDDNLPENITVEQDRQLGQYRQQFVAASTSAIGDLAVETLTANAQLAEVTAELSFSHKNRINVAVERVREQRIPASKTGETTTVYGATSVSVHTFEGSSNAQLKAVRKEIQDAAAAALM